MWDTVQALSSYIRGMLSSQAVLVGVGVGKEVGDWMECCLIVSGGALQHLRCLLLNCLPSVGLTVHCMCWDAENIVVVQGH